MLLFLRRRHRTSHRARAPRPAVLAARAALALAVAVLPAAAFAAVDLAGAVPAAASVRASVHDGQDAPPPDTVHDATVDVTVRADGTAHVEVVLPTTFARPEQYPRLYWNIASARPWTAADGSQPVGIVTLQTLSDVQGTITTAGGDVLPGSSADVRPGASTQSLTLSSDSLAQPVDAATFHISYDVSGAVLEHGSGPRVELPVVAGYLTSDVPDVRVSVHGPDGDMSPTCTTASVYDPQSVPCARDAAGTVTATSLDDGLVVVAAVPGARATEPVVGSAHADTIDEHRFAYVVQPDGTLDVTETLTYRFGDSSGRHGIQRDLVVREPYSAARDRTYGVTVLDVQSPSGDDATYTTSETGRWRHRMLAIRVGDPDVTVDSPTATYVLHYAVTGALLRSDDGATDELSWDVTGFLGDAYHRSVDVTVSVPGQVVAARCWAGYPGSTDPCAKASASGGTSGGTATFHADDVAAGEGVTVDVTTPAIAGAHVGPDLAFRGEVSIALVYLEVLGLAGLASLVVSALVLLVVRWVRRDERPASDRQVPRTTPPDVPLPVAGVLLDGVFSVQETTAVLMALAARGAIAFVPVDGSYRIRIHDVDAGRDDFERVVMTCLVKASGPAKDGSGAARTMTRSAAAKAVVSAHRALLKAVRADLADRQKKDPLFRGRVRLRTHDIWPWWRTLLALPVPGLLPAVAAWRLNRSLRPTGRTAHGRELADQVDGFRDHLVRLADDARAPGPKGPATLTAQDDVFGTLLPWAVALGVDDRWAEPAAQLTAAGLLEWPTGIPQRRDADAPWVAHWLLYELTQQDAAARAASRSSSGSSRSGSSGGSYSGGGGFSGGGGGGGGTSSW